MKWKMKWHSMVSRYLLGWVVMLSILSSCSDKKAKQSRVENLPYYAEATFTPHWYNDEEALPFDFHKVPPFTLVNQNGDTITEQHFEGKVYVADFFFTSCPGICPTMTANLGIVQEAFKEDDGVMLLSHSVTPMRDSVEVLRDYANRKGVIDGKWELTTGERKEIYELGRRAYFAEEDLGEAKGENDFLHTENFILVDKSRHVRGIYNGLNKGDVDQLIADIKTLQKEG